MEQFFRIDASEKIEGRLPYASDLVFYGMLHAHVFRSTSTHGEILELDLKDAAASKGVAAIISARDFLDKAPYGQPLPGYFNPIRDFKGEERREEPKRDDKGGANSQAKKKAADKGPGGDEEIEEELPSEDKDSAEKNGSNRNRLGDDTNNLPVFAHRRVRYFGEPVAAIAGLDLDSTRQAARRIHLRMKEIEAAMTIEDALATDAPFIHDFKAIKPPPNTQFKLLHNSLKNVFCHRGVKTGDTLKGFKASEVLLERTYEVGPSHPAYLEPEVLIARPESHGGITLFGSMMHPNVTRNAVHFALGIPLSKVQVVQLASGGHFGGKDEVLTLMAVRAAMLAYKTGRPVRMANTREESFLDAPKRTPVRCHYKIGLSKKGKVNALASTIFVDSGAYSSLTFKLARKLATLGIGPYNIPNVQVDVFGVYTNTVYSGSDRGFGSTQVHFAHESLMDECAHELKLDPVAFRGLNLITKGSVTVSGQKIEDPSALKNCIQRVATTSNWGKKEPSKKEPPKKDKGGKDRLVPTPFYIKRGFGFACGFEGIVPQVPSQASVATLLQFHDDGSLSIAPSIGETGEGLNTIFAQIVSETLGVTAGNIVVLPTDTSRISGDSFSQESDRLYMGCKSVLEAAKTLEAKLKTAAMELFGVKSPVGIVFGDDKAKFAAKKKTIPLLKVIRHVKESGQQLSAFGVARTESFENKKVKHDGETYTAFTSGAMAVEVEVNTCTGVIKVLNCYLAQDIGKIINPQLVKNQIGSELAMGLGVALFERYDYQKGKLINPGFTQYRLPRCGDMPKFHLEFEETTDKSWPMGIKSLGGPGGDLFPAAIANAVFSATGVRLRQLPLDHISLIQFKPEAQ